MLQGNPTGEDSRQKIAANTGGDKDTGEDIQLDRPTAIPQETDPEIAIPKRFLREPLPDLNVLVERALNRTVEERAAILDAYYKKLLKVRTDTMESGLERLELKLENALRDLPNASSITQIGTLSLLPAQGTAFIFSDLQGDFSVVQRAMQHHSIIERMREAVGGTPDKAVYLVFQGDIINRADNNNPMRQASYLLEFLHDLEGFAECADKIVMIPGNHELYPESIIDFRNPNGGFYMDLHSRIARESGPNFQSQSGLEIISRYLRHLEISDPETLSIIDSDFSRQNAPIDLLQANLFANSMLHTHLKSFELAPKAAFTANGILMTHGGIPAQPPFTNLFNIPPCSSRDFPAVRFLSALAQIYVPSAEEVRQEVEDGKYHFCNWRNMLLKDLSWGDYFPEAMSLGDNSHRSGAKIVQIQDPEQYLGASFGPKQLADVLNLIGGSLMIRGHQGRAPSGSESFKTGFDGVDFSLEQIIPGVWGHQQVLTLNSNRGTYIELDLSEKPKHFRDKGIKVRQVV